MGQTDGDESAEVDVQAALEPEPRPTIADLVLVDDEQFLYRALPPTAWDAKAARGAQLTLAFLDRKDFNPTDDSYGASVWVVSILEKLGGLEELKKHHRAYLVSRGLNPRKADFRGFSMVSVRDVRALNIEVVFSPHDADFRPLETAHASLLKLDKVKRAQFRDLCDGDNIVYPPTTDDEPKG